MADRDRIIEQVRDHWDGRAATFDDQPEHAMHSEAQRRRWLAVLEEWAGDGPRTTLDAGCGTGVISFLLADLGHDVTGIDAAPAMIERARLKADASDHDVAFGLGDAERLGFVDDAFEQIVERHLLWTLPEPAAALAEWCRVVEPGGRIVTFEGRWNHEEDPDFSEDLPLYEGRSGEKWAAIVANAGLREVRVEPLDDPVLRGREPGAELPHEYVVLAGTVPG